MIILTFLFSLVVGLCYCIWYLIIWIFKGVAYMSCTNAKKRREAENVEEIDDYVWSELEAYVHQLETYRLIYKQVEHDIKQQKFVNRLSWDEELKLKKKLADTEAKMAGIQKKIKKLTNANGIDYEV